MHYLADHRSSAAHRRTARHVLAALAPEVEALLRATAAYGGAEVETARSRVRRQLDALRVSVGSSRVRPRAGLRGLCGTAADCARKHIWTSLAMAGLAGMAAGCCLRARVDRHAGGR